MKISFKLKKRRIIMAEGIKTIDEYIIGFEPMIQKTLNEFRNFIKSEVPETTEKYLLECLHFT